MLLSALVPQVRSSDRALSRLDISRAVRGREHGRALLRIPGLRSLLRHTTHRERKNVIDVSIAGGRVAVNTFSIIE